jgi:hypothetical protein
MKLGGNHCGTEEVTTQAPQDVEFAVIGRHLDTIQIAAANKIERDPIPLLLQVPRARSTLESLLRLSTNTYRTIRYICADKPPDHARKLEYAVSAPPLIRTILDALFSIVFLFDDLPNHVDWFWKSGWRELSETHDRYTNAYAADPAWQDFLSWHRQFLDGLQSDCQVTAAEVQNPKLVNWWPNPGQMLRYATLSPSRKQLLQHLNDWFYRALSAESHMSAFGLMRRAGHIIDAGDAEARVAVLEKYKSDCVITTVTLLTALVSELEVELDLGLNERAKYLWGVLVPFWGASQEVYDLRYSTLLG